MTGDQSYELTNGDGSTVAFTGRVIGEVDARNEDVKWRRSTERWSELRIYTTTDGRWVAEWTGLSSVPGERPRTTACFCDTPRSVLEGVMHPRGGFVTDLSLTCFRRAAAIDDRLSPILARTIQRPPPR